MAAFLKVIKTQYLKNCLTKWNLMYCHYINNEKSQFKLVNITNKNVL